MIRRPVGPVSLRKTATILLFAFLLMWPLTDAKAQTRLGPLGAGLACNPAVYNPGTAPVTADCSITPQLFVNPVGTNCTVNATCVSGSTNDSARTLVATASGITITLPGPGANGASGYSFALDPRTASNFNLKTPSGVIYGCGTAGATVNLAYSAAVATDGTNWLCTPFAAGTAPVGGGGTIAWVRDNFASSAASNLSSFSVTLSATNAGDLFVVSVRGFNSGGVSQISGSTVSTGNGTTCAHVAGAFNAGVATSMWADMWNCPNNAAAGSVTFTVTYASVGSSPNTTNYPQLAVGEFSGAKTSGADMGLGSSANITTAATSLSIATTGSAGVGDLVVSTSQPSVASPTGYGANQTAFSSDVDTSYQIVASPGIITHSYNYAAANAGVFSIGAFAHP
jgi:hypothetical protein